MADIPLDAQRVVDELRAARRETAAAAPKNWTPSELFDSAITSAVRTPVRENAHLGWMHQHWDVRELLAPPRQKGVKGLVKRTIHRAVMAVFAPYFERMQDYMGVNVRAVEAVSRRTDDNFTAQLRVMEAVRSDVIDFAGHVDERGNG